MRGSVWVHGLRDTGTDTESRTEQGEREQGTGNREQGKREKRKEKRASGLEKISNQDESN